MQGRAGFLGLEVGMRLGSVGDHRHGLAGLAGDGFFEEWFVDTGMGPVGSQVAGGGPGVQVQELGS